MDCSIGCSTWYLSPSSSLDISDRAEIAASAHPELRTPVLYQNAAMRKAVKLCRDFRTIYRSYIVPCKAHQYSGDLGTTKKNFFLFSLYGRHHSRSCALFPISTGPFPHGRRLSIPSQNKLQNHLTAYIFRSVHWYGRQRVSSFSMLAVDVRRQSALFRFLKQTAGFSQIQRQE